MTDSSSAQRGSGILKKTKRTISLYIVLLVFCVGRILPHSTKNVLLPGKAASWRSLGADLPVQLGELSAGGDPQLAVEILVVKFQGIFLDVQLFHDLCR